MRWLLSALAPFALFAQPSKPPLAKPQIPQWCRDLPRPEYKSLERVAIRDPWFEVYKAAPGVFAIYEPHQSEETISYLILGATKALLFDTGMGISDIRAVVASLTQLPVVVLNSHTHNDHVGGNWQFDSVFGMDMAFTRENAKGGRESVQGEIAPGEICGELPKGFDRARYATRGWKIAKVVRDGEKIDLGGRVIEVLSTPGHTPDATCLLDRAGGLLFTGDTYYPGEIWLYRPETDFAAYAQSMRRLVALSPSLKMVLGAHNVPVAKPDALTQTKAAFEAVRQGKVSAKPGTAGKVTYRVDDIRFLMRAPK